MNFRRKHRKEYSITTCGQAHCRYDIAHIPAINGTERYPAIYWKKLAGGRRLAKYMHKNVKNYEDNVDLPN